MALHLSIEVDEPLRVGERVSATVVIEATKEHAIEGLSLSLEGLHALYETAEAYTTFVSTAAPLLGASRIAPGRHEHRAELDLRASLPPTMDLPTVYYRLTARARIPWWFDVEERRDVRVVLPPPDERPAPRRVTVASDALGRDALFLELTLDDTCFAPGESITGAFSVGNTQGQSLDAAAVTVVPCAGAVAGGLPGGGTAFRSLVGAAEGSVLRFSIPIPPGTAPSCATEIGEVAHEVVLRVDGHDVTCTVPITIAAFERRERAGTLDAGAREGPLGAVRWRFAWRDEGARHGLSLDGRALRLRGTLAGEVSARVRSAGAGIRATLRWKSLGIGLALANRGLRSRARAGAGGSAVDLSTVDPSVSHRFTVRGWEDAQVVALLDEPAGVGEALLAFDEVAVDDAGAKLEGAGPARDPLALRRFLDALHALARSVVAAEARLPAPAWAAGDVVQAWRAFAQASGGRLHPGRMAITGAFAAGDRLAIETLRDDRGEPSRTRITLALDPPLPRGVPAGADGVVLTAVRDRDVSGARAEIHAEEIVLALDGATRDPETLRLPITEMQRLARRLRGDTGRGPYR